MNAMKNKSARKKNQLKFSDSKQQNSQADISRKGGKRSYNNLELIDIEYSEDYRTEK